MFFLEAGCKIKKKEEEAWVCEKNETIYCHGISGGFIGNDASYGSGTTRTSNESAGYCEWF